MLSASSKSTTSIADSHCLLRRIDELRMPARARLQLLIAEQESLERKAKYCHDAILVLSDGWVIRKKEGIFVSLIEMTRGNDRTRNRSCD